MSAQNSTQEAAPRGSVLPGRKGPGAVHLQLEQQPWPLTPPRPNTPVWNAGAPTSCGRAGRVPPQGRPQDQAGSVPGGGVGPQKSSGLEGRPGLPPHGGGGLEARETEARRSECLACLSSPPCTGCSVSFGPKQPRTVLGHSESLGENFATTRLKKIKIKGLPAVKSNS